LVFYRELLESLRTLPGVRSAAVSSGIPFGLGNYTTTPMTTVGRSALPVGAAVPIDWRLVSPDYFRSLRLPVLRGRVFTDADDANAAPAVVVSRMTAEKLWAAEDPVGRTIRRVADGQDFTVIGVVGDTRNTALNQQTPELYYSSATRVWPLMDVVVRT